MLSAGQVCVLAHSRKQQQGVDADSRKLQPCACGQRQAGCWHWTDTASGNVRGGGYGALFGSEMKGFFQRWLVTAVAVLVATQLVPGLEYDSLGGLLTASLVLGILNAFLRPLLLLLSLPILLLTFGLFAWIVNAGLLYFVGYLVKSFHVNNFWAALWGALAISIVSMVVNLLLGQKHPPAQPRRPQGGGGPPVDTGSGPVIDV